MKAFVLIRDPEDGKAALESVQRSVENVRLRVAEKRPCRGELGLLAVYRGTTEMVVEYAVTCGGYDLLNHLMLVLEEFFETLNDSGPHAKKPSKVTLVAQAIHTVALP